jgi:hypothetical protein
MTNKVSAALAMRRTINFSSVNGTRLRGEATLGNVEFVTSQIGEREKPNTQKEILSLLQSLLRQWTGFLKVRLTILI